jgi:hypothetical protein
MEQPQIEPIPVTPEQLAAAADGAANVKGALQQLDAAGADIMAPAATIVSDALGSLDGAGKQITARLNRLMAKKATALNNSGAAIVSALTTPVQSTLDTVADNSAQLYQSVPEFSYHPGGPPQNPLLAPTPTSPGAGAPTVMAGRLGTGASTLSSPSGSDSTPISASRDNPLPPVTAPTIPAPSVAPGSFGGASWFWCDPSGGPPLITFTGIPPDPQSILITTYQGDVPDDPASLELFQAGGCPALVLRAQGGPPGLQPPTAESVLPPLALPPPPQPSPQPQPQPSPQPQPQPSPQPQPAPGQPPVGCDPCFAWAVQQIAAAVSGAIAAAFGTAGALAYANAYATATANPTIAVTAVASANGAPQRPPRNLCECILKAANIIAQAVGSGAPAAGATAQSADDGPAPDSPPPVPWDDWTDTPEEDYLAEAAASAAITAVAGAAQGVIGNFGITIDPFAQGPPTGGAETGGYNPSTLGD